MFFKKKKEENITKKNSLIENLDKFSDMDVDPIAEADVYFAYGRDKQAMEILNEALSLGKISQERYDDFLLSHNKNSITTNKVSKVEQNSYYVSITYVLMSKIYKKRFQIVLNHKIETKNGIKDLETQIKEKIETEDWTLDSFIKIVD